MQRDETDVRQHDWRSSLRIRVAPLRTGTQPPGIVLLWL